MADPIEIPLATDTPLYSERVTLDGKEFLFAFDWNDRENRWYLSISTIDGQPLAMGIKVIANWPLLSTRINPALPQGNLTAIDFSPQNGEPPGYSDLGQRVRLLYFPPG